MSERNGSSDNFQATATEGKYANLLFAPNLDEPSALIDAVTRYLLL